MNSHEHQPHSIDRGYHVSIGLAITNSAATSATIDFRGVAGGVVFIPAGSSITTLTVYSCATIDGTYVPLHGADGAAAELTVAASEAHQLPAACYGCPFLRFVGDAAGVVDVAKIG